MANVCQIRVNSAGQYCCDIKHLSVYADCIGSIKFSNLPATTIEYEVTPDNWIPATPGEISGSGCETLFKAGEYRFNVDCADYDGVDAPEVDPVGLCYECCKVDDWGAILSTQLEVLCAKIVAGNDAAATAEVIAQLEAICTKLLDLIANIGDLSELCDKLEAVIATLTTLCEKIEAGFADMTAILNSINTAIAEVVTQLEAICTKLDTLHGDNELICTKLDNILAVLGTELAAILVCLGELKAEQVDQGLTLDQILGCFEELKEKTDLDVFKVVKPGGVEGANYEGAIAITAGRPLPTVPWSLIDNRLPPFDATSQVVVASGNTFQEFSADLEVKGFTQWIEGEIHYVCPCPPGLVQAGDYFVEADGNTVTKPACTPRTELPNFPADKEAPEEECALRTTGCQDDRRDQLLEQILEKLCQILGDPEDVCDCPSCPELILGDAEFITESDNGNLGDSVVFPLTSPLNQTSDIGVPLALPLDDCFTDPDAPIVVRWCFDHSIDPSSNHTGFNVSANDGAAVISGAVVGQSATGTTNVGPGATPHTGPRDKYWVDIQVTVAQLQAGIMLQTSAFGAVNGELETIHSQDVSIKTDLAELGCC